MGICIGRPGGMVVASSGMIGLASRISITLVLKCAARAGNVSPVCAMYATISPGLYSGRVGNGVTACDRLVWVAVELETAYLSLWNVPGKQAENVSTKPSKKVNIRGDSLFILLAENDRFSCSDRIGCDGSISLCQCALIGF